jgi:Y-box-binding protein 1
VTRDDGEGDVFVHQSDIYSQGFRSLRNQEPVEFGLEPIGDGRFKAVNVRALSSVRVTRERLRQTNPDLPVCSCDPFAWLFLFFVFLSDISTPRTIRRFLRAQVTGPNGAFVQGAVARNANKTRSPFMANRGAGIPGMYGPGAYFGGVPFAGPMPPGMPPGMVPGIPYGVGPHGGMMGPGGFPGAMGMVPMPNPPMMGEYGPGGGRRVVVLNLPWHTSWQALKQFFASAGEVERADVALDESGKSRGYGTVRYATETQAMNAIRTLNGLDFEGRILTVRMDKYQE